MRSYLYISIKNMLVRKKRGRRNRMRESVVGFIVLVAAVLAIAFVVREYIDAVQHFRKTE